MINKINNMSGNNISFKRVVPTPALLNMPQSNAEKLDMAIEMINKHYPQNDVFIGADDNGELVYQIQKADPSIELFNSDVLAKTKVNPQELATLLNLCKLYKAVYNRIHNIKEPVAKYKTNNIEKLSPQHIAMGIKYSLDEFNKKYPPEKPN